MDGVHIYLLNKCIDTNLLNAEASEKEIHNLL